MVYKKEHEVVRRQQIAEKKEGNKNVLICVSLKGRGGKMGRLPSFGNGVPH